MLRGNKIATELARYIAERPREPFAWATAHCCHFAAGWLVHTGQPDPLAGMPETPDAMAAIRLVREYGDLRGLVSHALGCEPISAALAQTGDLVLVRSYAAEGEGVGHQLGICSGVHIVVTDARGGPCHLPAAEGICAWRLYGAQ